MTTDPEYDGLVRQVAAAPADEVGPLIEALHARYLELVDVGTFAANTPSGLPYPLPTDPLSGGADAIKNLATVLNNGRTIVPVADAAARDALAAAYAPTAAKPLHVWRIDVKLLQFTSDGVNWTAVQTNVKHLQVGNATLGRTEAVLVGDGTPLQILNLPPGKFQVSAKGFTQNRTAYADIDVTLKLTVSAGTIDQVTVSPMPQNRNAAWSLMGTFQSAVPWACNVSAFWTGTQDAGSVISAWNGLAAASIVW